MLILEIWVYPTGVVGDLLCMCIWAFKAILHLWHMSYSLNPLNGVICGSMLGSIIGLNELRGILGVKIIAHMPGFKMYL